MVIDAKNCNEGKHAMHVRSFFGMIGLATLLVGCEVTKAEYRDRTDAASRNAFQAGWLPEWLPEDAVDIRETHDADTNESWLVFRLTSGHWMVPDECAETGTPDLSSAQVMRRFPQFARDAWSRVSDDAGDAHRCADRRWVMWDQERQFVYSWTDQ